MSTTALDIQKFNLCEYKARENDIIIDVKSEGFLLTRRSDYCILGKILTVEEMYSYFCGYESGLDKGLSDS